RALVELPDVVLLADHDAVVALPRLPLSAALVELPDLALLADRDAVRALTALPQAPDHVELPQALVELPDLGLLADHDAVVALPRLPLSAALVELPDLALLADRDAVKALTSLPQAPDHVELPHALVELPDLALLADHDAVVALSRLPLSAALIELPDLGLLADHEAVKALTGLPQAPDHVELPQALVELPDLALLADHDAVVALPGLPLPRALVDLPDPALLADHDALAALPTVELPPEQQVEEVVLAPVFLLPVHVEPTLPRALYELADPALLSDTEALRNLPGIPEPEPEPEAVEPIVLRPSTVLTEPIEIVGPPAVDEPDATVTPIDHLAPIPDVEVLGPSVLDGPSALHWVSDPAPVVDDLVIEPLTEAEPDTEADLADAEVAVPEVTAPDIEPVETPEQEAPEAPGTGDVTTISSLADLLGWSETAPVAVPVEAPAPTPDVEPAETSASEEPDPDGPDRDEPDPDAPRVVTLADLLGRPTPEPADEPADLAAAVAAVLPEEPTAEVVTLEELLKRSKDEPEKPALRKGDWTAAPAEVVRSGDLPVGDAEPISPAESFWDHLRTPVQQPVESPTEVEPELEKVPKPKVRGGARKRSKKGKNKKLPATVAAYAPAPPKVLVGTTVETAEPVRRRGLRIAAAVSVIAVCAAVPWVAPKVPDLFASAVPDKITEPERTPDPTIAPPDASGSPLPVPDPGLVGKRLASAGRPVQLTVPRLKVDSPVVDISLDGTQLTPPSDPQLLGWWDGGREVGARSGSAVITGHTVSVGGGAFDHLGELVPGDRIRVRTDKGTIVYAVTESRNVPTKKLAKQSAQIFNQSGEGRLVLITCSQFNGHIYLANSVVYATPIKDRPNPA
ncbi:MAG: sortase domain-bontaining protein, partial [Marmoricola sp.]